MKRFALLLLCGAIACNEPQNPVEPEPSKPAVTGVTRADQLLRDIEKYPDSTFLKEVLIQLYRDSGDLRKAMSITDGFLAKDSINETLWEKKSVLHFLLGDTLAAVHAYERVYGIHPVKENLAYLGLLYAQTKNKKALHVADELLSFKNSKDMHDAWYIKGFYYSFINEKQKAVDYFDKCISINHTSTDASREKAIALYDMGKYDEAIKALDRAVALNNSFDEGYFYRGRCYEKLGKIQDAIDDYQLALMYAGNDYPEAKDALARLGVKTN